MKSYSEYMNEISPDELFDGLLGHGLFAEKLPPVFTSENFCEYYKSNISASACQKNSKFIYFESMRHTNIPRAFGIPEPFAYAKLCTVLKDNWDRIRNVLQANTANDDYKVSRIHIRKMSESASLMTLSYDQDLEPEDEDAIVYDTLPETPESMDYSDSINNDAIFAMNYKNWKLDGDPMLNFSLGMRYVVKTDISQCFPSAYSHSIPWALEGKTQCKSNVRNKIAFWSDELDKACRGIKDNETNGLIIGPHASNVLSEIILTAIDKKVRSDGFKYIRNIDDYTCYVESYEKAEEFLVKLSAELREYCFTLNYKKTTIEELPQASAEEWVQILKDKYAIERDNEICYDMARAYLDTAILAMKNNGNSAASLFFAIKVLGNADKPITEQAQNYCIRRMCDLAIIYPYLLPNMEQYVFEAFNASSEIIENFTRVLYEDSIKRKNYEGVSYSLYYAVKYDFKLPVNEDEIIGSSDCISKILLWIYSCKYNEHGIKNKLHDKACNLAVDYFDEYWVFIYEILSDTELPVEWQALKRAGVSFLCYE